MTRHSARARTVLLALGAAIGLGVATSSPAAADDGLRVDRGIAPAGSELSPARTGEAVEVAVWSAHVRLAEVRRAKRTARDALTAAARRAEEARLRLDAAGRIYRDAVAEVEQARERVNSLSEAAFGPSLWTSGGPTIESWTSVGAVDRQRYENLLDAQRAQIRARVKVTDAEEMIRTWAAALVAALAERSESLRRYQTAEADERDIEQKMDRGAVRRQRAASSHQAPQAPHTSLLLPVEGRKTSDFGNRLNPYSKQWRHHDGVDIAAPGGTPIRAAADGTVTRAGWNGGYGNYTCLEHAGGLSTCYAHQSQILVKPGQQVRRGEVIGKVGSTGNSTGDHLHFEVRRNGTAVDPTPYLPALH